MSFEVCMVPSAVRATISFSIVTDWKNLKIMFSIFFRSFDIVCGLQWLLWIVDFESFKGEIQMQGWLSLFRAEDIWRRFTNRHVVWWEWITYGIFNNEWPIRFWKAPSIDQDWVQSQPIYWFMDPDRMTMQKWSYRSSIELYISVHQSSSGIALPKFREKSQQTRPS